MFIEYLKGFETDNKNILKEVNTSKTSIEKVNIDNIEITRYTNEFWTSKQRQANSIHEISYRACFKPQLPRFFINRLTKEGDFIYDPFLGRGTTIIEAGLLNRKVIGNDINPLSIILSEPRFLIPDYNELKEYLQSIPVYKNLRAEIDLSMFYHKDTEGEIVSLKNYLLEKSYSDSLNKLDKWIRMISTNRLTGHSKGFFSVYTMPPNQAVSSERQIRINKKYNQRPDYRNVKEIILSKTKSLIKDITPLEKIRLADVYKTAVFLNSDARLTKIIPDNFVQLTVTSPPFLDVVQYAQDNWLRCWFNGINVNEIEKRITISKTLEHWITIMQDVFYELFRITKKDGYVAFEVGEVKNGKVNLDEHILPLGVRAGFSAIAIIINEQPFTKTANIWGINNNRKGTNTNRIVLFKK
ncbi:MAG: site-specific DNA-methyltransferase [Ignavibacterium sp.]|nr:site-specific DNA-methyltransferase [Ignavibacterium sp.]